MRRVAWRRALGIRGSSTVLAGVVRLLVGLGLGRVVEDAWPDFHIRCEASILSGRGRRLFNKRTLTSGGGKINSEMKETTIRIFQPDTTIVFKKPL